MRLSERKGKGLDMGGEHQACDGTPNAGPALDLREELLQRSCIMHPHLEQVRGLTGDGMAFQDFRAPLAARDKFGIVHTGFDQYEDKCGDVVAEGFGVELGEVPFDDALLLQFAQVLAHGSDGESDGFCDFAE